MNYNENDIITFYNLHNHKQETELRTIDRNKQHDNAKSYFVHNEKELVEKIKELEKQPLDFYIGINERKQNGTEGKDVISLNGFIADIEGVNHDIQFKPAAKELCDLYVKDLNNKKIKTNFYDTGRGYRILVTLEEPVPIMNDEERTHAEKILSRIKEYFKNTFKVNNAQEYTEFAEQQTKHQKHFHTGLKSKERHQQN
jgi:hypothetical protein